MQKVLLKIENKETSLDFPENSSEVSLSKALRFIENTNKIRLYFEEIEKANEDSEILVRFDKAKYLNYVAETLASFFNCSITDILGNKLGDYEKHLLNIDSNDIDIVLDGILNLFNSLTNIILKYESKDFRLESEYKFVHNGTEYFIPYRFKDFENPNLTVGQTIEILEAKRIAELNQNINSTYTQMITSIAVLSRKKDEAFPNTQNEIDNFIKQRTNELKDINMSVAFDVSFFLFSGGQI